MSAENTNNQTPATNSPSVVKKILLAVGVLAILMGIAAAVMVGLGQKNSPEASLEKAWVYLQKNDLTSFEQYVRIQDVAESMVDESLRYQSLQNAQDESLSGDLKERFTQGVLGFLQPELMGRFSEQIKQLVRTGAVTQNGLVTVLWENTGGRADDFIGVNISKEEERLANAALTFGLPEFATEETPNPTASLTLILEKAADTWTVTGFEDLAEFLKQLDAYKMAKLEAINEPIQTALAQAIEVIDLQKSSGMSQWGIGRGVVFRMAYRNNTDSDIRAMHADILVRNQHGELLKKVTIHDRDGMGSGEVVEKSWPMTVNPLSESDDAIYQAEGELQLSLSPFHIEFADGTELKTYETIQDAGIGE